MHTFASCEGRRVPATSSLHVTQAAGVWFSAKTCLPRFTLLDVDDDKYTEKWKSSKNPSLAKRSETDKAASVEDRQTERVHWASIYIYTLVLSIYLILQDESGGNLEL